MKTQTKSEVEITLILNAREALYLKSLLQNPPCDLADECPTDNIIRTLMFQALPDFTYLTLHSH